MVVRCPASFARTRPFEEIGAAAAVIGICPKGISNPFCSSLFVVLINFWPKLEATRTLVEPSLHGAAGGQTAVDVISRDIIVPTSEIVEHERRDRFRRLPVGSLLLPFFPREISTIAARAKPVQALFKSAQTTVAPDDESASAMARPLPELDPLTMAIWFSSRVFITFPRKLV